MVKLKEARLWTEAEVVASLASVWPSPAHTILAQVRNGTGFSRHRTRTADAIVVSTWPCRGLWMAGVEVKVSRSDWRKELAHPEKAAELQKYCRYWYVAAPAGVVPAAEVPETWGHIEVTARGAAIQKAAPVLEAVDPDMLLVCSILRTAAETMVPAVEVADRVRAQLDDRRKAWERERDFAHEELREAVQAFEEASGIEIRGKNRRWEMGRVGNCVKLMQAAGVDRILDQIDGLRTAAARIVEEIDLAKGEFSVKDAR
jgi:hypothetical protein